MIREMRRVFRAGVCVVVLSACGGSDGTSGVEAQEGGGRGGTGGGGAGAGSGGRDTGGGGDTGDGAFVVTPAALTFTAVQNGPLPEPQSIHVHRADTTATFGSSWANYGYAPGWLDETSFARVDTTASDFDLDFAIDTTNLTPGTYSTTYNAQLTKSFYCDPTGGPCIPVDVIGKKTIPITYVVTAP